MSIKIYIDQGHNPENPNAGAEGNGLREQDLVYVIGQRLADRLRANPDFEVRLSRPTRDTQLGTSNGTSLSARVNDANRWVNAFSNYYALAVHEPMNGIDRLIFNITELGGRAAVRRIIERKKKNDQPL